MHAKLQWLNSAIFFTTLSVYFISSRAQDDFSCGPSRPCSNGACCGPSGFCGYGADFCGTGCSSNCNAHAACGKDALVPNTTCPLNVCCSQFGFCGTTSDFCGTGCQNGCKTPSAPTCSGGNSATNRIIGYYESWATTRACSAWHPEQLNPNAYTHINFAFASIDGSSFSIVPAAPSDVDLYTRTTALKASNPDLKVFISVGGWAFNDPPTQNIFSNLAASSNNRQSFIKSLISFFQTYGFDGVDIDWEYPVAPERGGKAADKENYVTLLKELKMAFDNSPGKYGLTITIPSSFWYLQNFDIVAMEPYVDWFNAMEYDLHGTWDGTDPFIGAIVNAHSNLTEIDISFDLLWRNGINPDKLVMGMGFYGRSFQLANPSCKTPGCPFSGPAAAGPCTNGPGTLSYSEIQDIITSKSVTPVWDHDAAVKYIVWDSNQWVSYDDKDTFSQKIDYANKKCIGGIMIWSADQDDDFGSALSAITGIAPQITKRAQVLAETLGINTGQVCSVTDCGQTCSSGFTALSVTKGKPTQPTYNCKKGQSREICCPSSSVPTGCTWRGTAPFCDGKCHDGEVQLTQDKSGDGHSCWTGTKALCCPETTSQDVLNQCTWFGTAPFCNGQCPSQGTTLQATTGGGGSGNGQPCWTGHKALCCPDPDPYENCKWFGTAPLCNGKCPTGQVQMYSDSYGDGHWCISGKKVYCCDPPNALIEPAVVQFENDLTAFAQSPTCDLSSELYRRSPVTTNKTPSKTKELVPRAAVSSSTLDRLIQAMLPVLLLYYQNLGNSNAPPLNAAQLGIIDAFEHVSPNIFGGVEFEFLANRLGNMYAVTSDDDGPFDPRADVQDMFCEAGDLNLETSEIMIATSTLCATTLNSCQSPSNCGPSSRRRDRFKDFENSLLQAVPDARNITLKALERRLIDQGANKASGSTGTNNVRPNLFDVINAIINEDIPMVEFSLFRSGTGAPDIQIEVIFDIRGHPELAEFPTGSGPANGFEGNRAPDRFIVLHFHLDPPDCIISGAPIDGARINVKAMNLWHGQIAGLHVNSNAIPWIEVRGLDSQRKKPNWGPNERMQLLNCPSGRAWAVEGCPRPTVIAGTGKNKNNPVPVGNDSRARVDLVVLLINWLRMKNILVWDFIDFMWDFDNNDWYDDDDHRRGPRYGPGPGPDGSASRGPSQLTAT